MNRASPVKILCGIVFLFASSTPNCVGQQNEGDDANFFAQPIATTVQLPTFGVAFDADGVLEMKTFVDPTGQLRERQRQAALIARQGELGKPNRSRKLSLVRLETAIRKRIEAGQTPDDAMLHLAGLTRITSAFCIPRRGDGDIVLTGPSEPWIKDFGGVARGIRTGRPVLRLDDLIVALRAYSVVGPPLGFVGCSIDPQPAGLARLQKFQRTIPKMVRVNQRDAVTRHVAAGTRDQLGPSGVVVFGISDRTHFARVLIEADYRMKRIALGVETPPIPITTYADAIRTASHGTLERWWLTPAYEGLKVTQDKMAIQITGQGVQLKTEIKRVDQAGGIIDYGGKPNRAATQYATSFTKQYEALAAASSVYTQLRQLCDMLILTAFMQRHRWYDGARWDASIFLDESIYAVETMPRPATAPAVVNSFWKQNRLFVPVGGGVSIEVSEAMRLSERADGELSESHRQIQLPRDAQRWWWD